MRTTIDVPDAMLERVKALAASRSMSLKCFVTEALEEHLRRCGGRAGRARTRAALDGGLRGAGRPRQREPAHPCVDRGRVQAACRNGGLEMTGELEGRVAIVTGAAGGIGREFVRGLLGAGAKVAALDIDEGRLADLAAGHEAAASSGRLIAARVDIASYAECEAAVERTRESLGGLHILVNNGAGGHGRRPVGPYDQPRRDSRDRPGGLGPVRRGEPFRGVVHDPRCGRGAARPGMGAHRQRHHQLLHHAAREVPSLRPAEGRARGDVRRPCRGIRRSGG